MKYINKNTGESISSTVYNQLTPSAQSNYVFSASEPTTVHRTVVKEQSGSGIVDTVVGVAICSVFGLFD